MKTAIVTDFLIQHGGAEQVTSELANLFPDADIYTLMALPDVLDEYFPDRTVFEHPKMENSRIRRKHYRKLLPLYPTYIEDFDFKSYDLVISSSYLFAKGILCDPSTLHISYIHTPMRQAWSKYHQYLQDENDVGRIAAVVLRYIMNYLRLWDVTSANRVDHFIANSSTVKKRVKNIYKREATVIHPPVKVEEYSKSTRPGQTGDYYITVGRLVPYKNVDLLVKTFNQLPDKKLYIVGNGNDKSRLQAMAQSANITFTGYIDESKKAELLSEAKAFLFAANEDFGMSPVESIAMGTPVIAYNKGGAQDYIQETINGCFFEQQNISCLKKALEKFDQMKFDPDQLRQSVASFDRNHFREKVKTFVDRQVAQES